MYFMRQLPLAMLLAMFPMLLLISCSHKIVCEKPLVSQMQLPANDTTKNCTVMVIQYKAGSNMTQVLDSATVSADTFKTFYYSFSENTDYKIVLRPQGKVHTFSGLHFNNESKKGSTGLDSDMCSTSGTYILDGNTVQIPFLYSYGANRIITVSI